MNEMKTLVQRVLEYLEPNPQKWSYWSTPQELAPVSGSACIQEFVKRIQEAGQKGEKVLVAGDYDCDGILATTIMVHGLRNLGIETGFYIPDRIKEGYGLHENTVNLCHKKGYSLIVTVDNGVKALPALELAHSLSMEVIVTDHHHLDEEVPCDILVHPDLMEEEFSSLCGAGIAYECIRALCVDTDYDLILAAIASVGDVMKVTGQTRALIQQGLKILNQTKEKHTFSLAEDPILNETSVGFQIVPKLNAIGRLSNLANVNNIVRYFLSEDEHEIRQFYPQITHVNDLRKKISSHMTNLALQKCAIQKPILIVQDPSFHEGVIGLVAGSLCSQFDKPAIILAKNPEGYKGSMRSPEGFDCMDFLKNYEKFSAFGGHVQAAGFSLDLDAYPSFIEYVEQKIKQYHWTKPESKTLRVDPSELDIKSVESLDQLRPFGPGFQFPAFYIDSVEIKSLYDLSAGKHRRYTLTSGLQCLYFNIPASQKSISVNSIQGFIGSVQINRYRGSKHVNFIIDRIVAK